VKEFKFTSPHTFILLEVKGQNETVVWNLEGGSPSALVRDGWSSKTLPPGTELKMTIDPLRSGAPGGAWGVAKTKLKDGSAVKHWAGLARYWSDFANWGRPEAVLM